MKRLAIALAALAALALPATASAWTSNHFYSPDPKHNIECIFTPALGGESIGCKVFSTGRVMFIKRTGNAITGWDAGTNGFKRGSTPVLGMNQTYTTGTGLRCHTGGDALRCWSRISGHGFWLAPGGQHGRF